MLHDSLIAFMAVIAVGFTAFWLQGLRSERPLPRPPLPDLLIGFVTNFFDTLGVGSFAPTTAAFKALGRVKDEDIPGTLNIGHALPTVAQALIFLGVVSVAPATLVTLIASAVCGALIGAHIMARASRRIVRGVMGLALLAGAALLVASNLRWMPSGGSVNGLEGPSLGFAAGITFILGGLMMAGVGFYAPCLITVTVLGMNPVAAFPIMMSACALLMPLGSWGFLRSKRYDAPAALGLTLAGIPAVLLAAFVVKSLPLLWLRWLVVIAALTAAGQMLAPRRADQMGHSVKGGASPP